MSFINKFEPPELAQLEPSRNASEARFCRRRSKTAKQMEINANYNLYTSENSKIFTICELYKQIWTAWLRTTWAAPESFRSTICRRLQKIAKQTEINQHDHLFTSKNTKTFKIWQFYNQIWTAWIRTTWAVPEPSRKASEARVVGVAQRLQNKRKSIKMTI